MKLPKDMDKGQCDKQQVLTSRFERESITGGDPYNRMMNNYSKKAKPPQMGVLTGPFSMMMGR